MSFKEPFDIEKIDKLRERFEAPTEEGKNMRASVEGSNLSNEILNPDIHMPNRSEEEEREEEDYEENEGRVGFNERIDEKEIPGRGEGLVRSDRNRRPPERYQSSAIRRVGGPRNEMLLKDYYPEKEAEQDIGIISKDLEGKLTNARANMRRNSLQNLYFREVERIPDKLIRVKEETDRTEIGRKKGGKGRWQENTIYVSPEEGSTGEYKKLRRRQECSKMVQKIVRSRVGKMEGPLFVETSLVGGKVCWSQLTEELKKSGGGKEPNQEVFTIPSKIWGSRGILSSRPREIFSRSVMKLI